MKALHLSLLIWILISVIGVFVGCEESRGSIEVIMTDESGKPYAGIIHVERVYPPTQTGALIWIDETGHYSISNIPAGRWEVEFYKKSGLPVGLEIVTVIGGETTILDFTIGAKPPPTGLPHLIFP